MLCGSRCQLKGTLHGCLLQLDLPSIQQAIAEPPSVEVSPPVPARQRTPSVHSGRSPVPAQEVCRLAHGAHHVKGLHLAGVRRRQLDVLVRIVPAGEGGWLGWGGRQW